jgi:hypothetical protein
MRSLAPFTSRSRRTLDARPRTPFVIAVALATLVLLAAVDWNPVAADRLREVDEIAIPAEEGEHTSENVAVGVDWLEVLEFGYSPVTGPDGQAMVALGVHFANPRDDGYLWGSVAVTAVDDEGTTHELARMFAGIVPPGGERRIGVLVPVDDVDPALLENGLWIEPVDMTLQEIDDDDPWPSRFWYTGPVPEIAVVASEELYVPAGVRLKYRIESGAEEELSLSTAVFFRDADGRLVGGMAFDPAARYLLGRDPYFEPNSLFTVPNGTSTRYLELRYDEIPAEADLDQVEVAFNTM